MESIGPQLKQAREAKGISIEQAQKDTRIHSKILKALEEDRINEVASGPIYIKGFIKKYADYLGLDGASLAEEYFKEHPKSAEQTLILKGESAPFRFPVKRLVSIGVTILIIVFGFRVLVHIGANARANLKSRPKVAKRVDAARTKVDIERTKQPPKSAPSETKIALSAPIQKGQNLILAVKTTNDVWLKVISDGAVIYENILKKGSQESWQATQSLEISTGRAEALNAELNGTKLGPLGKGVVKGILITKDGVKLPK